LLRSAHPKSEFIHLGWNRARDDAKEIQRSRLKGDHFTYLILVIAFCQLAQKAANRFGSRARPSTSCEHKNVDFVEVLQQFRRL
jgi:hypothetical protein